MSFMAGHATRDLAEVAAEASRRTGIDFSGARGPWLRSAVQRAVHDYRGDVLVDALEDDAVFARFCDDVTVKESFFFREPARLDLVSRIVLPTLAEKPGVMSVWSAGCAAGQEAYSLAARLRGSLLAGRYRILGTDLSTAAVAEAQAGVYTRWSMRGVDDAAVARYFTVTPSGFRVKDDIRADVSFARHNLLTPAPRPVGGFDLIFCRNVLIYLTPPAIEQVVRRLVDALASGGWLVTSASDPLLDDVEGLEAVLTEHGLAYRRAGDAAPPVPAPTAGTSRPVWRRTTEPRVARTSARSPLPPPPNAPAPADLLTEGERALQLADSRCAHDAASRVLAGGTREHAAAAHALLVQAFAGAGDLERAVDASAQAVTAFPMDAGLRQLQAVVLLEAGRVPQAAAAARTALYLDPGLAPAHLVLGRCQDLMGDARAAGRSRRAALRLLDVAAP
jgi:chemotaxis protein methyltransferase CheR